MSEEIKNNEKPELDWTNLGFGYHETPARFVAHFTDGKWDEGGLTADPNVVLSESACVLHYSQAVFEGLKAYRTEDGRIICFRPELNAQRINDSCERMAIPPIPDGMFMRAVDETVKANADYVPPYGTGASLYLRPIAFGTTPVVGVKPALDYEFRLFATPVGPYFKGGMKPLRLRLSLLDRAAPHGTGHIKAGLNYAMSLYNIVDAHKNGYDENIYLDSATRTYVEETGGANLIFVDGNGTVVTPLSDTILPSITRRSLMSIAAALGFRSETRRVRADELGNFVCAGLCGTAAVISPVGSIDTPSGTIKYDCAENDVIHTLYNTLRAIQLGKLTRIGDADVSGWIHEVRQGAPAGK